MPWSDVKKIAASLARLDGFGDPCYKGE